MIDPTRWEIFLKSLGLIKDTQPAPPTRGNYPEQGFPSPVTAEETSNYKLQDLFRGPAMDSLGQLFSKGPPPIPYTFEGSNAGEYRKGAHALGLSTAPQAYQADSSSYRKTPASTNITRPKEVLIHEMGHAFRAVHGESNPERWKAIERQLLADPSESQQTKDRIASSELKRASKEIDPYYRDNPDEEKYAQAFVNAYRYLTDTAKDPKMDYRGYLGKLEGNTPGTGDIVLDLLKTKLFQKHPLQEVFQPKEYPR